jgi:drug/metabolite transporter (DMT)-like permease
MSVARAPVLRVHLALLAVQLAFSGLQVVGKHALAFLPPLAIACLRVLFATPVLFLLARREPAPARRLWPRLALLGLLGVFANQVLFIVGLQHTSATNAAILMPSIPVFTVAVGALLGVERIGPRRVLGVVLASAGALVLLDPRRLTMGGDALLGNALILANCLSYASFMVLQRPLLERLSGRSLLAWSFLFGGAGVLLVGAPALAAVAPATVPVGVWWGLAFILLFPTLLGYTLNTWAIQRSSATLAAAYSTLQPPLTGALAFVTLGETWAWREVLGFLLIAAGLWRVSVRPPRR